MDVEKPVLPFFPGNAGRVFEEDVPAQDVLFVGLEFIAHKVLRRLGGDKACSYLWPDRRHREGKVSLWTGFRQLTPPPFSNTPVIEAVSLGFRRRKDWQEAFMTG